MSSSNYEWAKGYWNAIHATSAWSDNATKTTYFNQWIRMMIENMPCGDCVRHGREYIKNNPPEKADDPFIWAWEYHNAVNRLTKKPEIEYSTIKKMWLEGGIRICDSGCGEGGTKQKADQEKGSTRIKDTYTRRYRPSRY